MNAFSKRNKIDMDELNDSHMKDATMDGYSDNQSYLDNNEERKSNFEEQSVVSKNKSKKR